VRLFIALTPSAVALGELEREVAPLRDARPDLRWASPQSWHVTLAFLGEVNGEMAVQLARRLGSTAASHPELSLRTAGGGAFPTVPKARVLWTGVSGDTEALGELAKSVMAAAREAGAPPPDAGRAFRPHVTLARSKEPADFRPLVTTLARYSGSVWAAERIHLIRSYLGPQPRYESIGDWTLGHPEPAAGPLPSGSGQEPTAPGRHA